MFSTGLIVFRETLEAALFIGIIAAATRNLPGSRRWLGAGVLAGALGAAVLAGGMEAISAWADGIGQDLVNAAILAVALAMLAWHCIWVSTHAHQMAGEARALGRSVSESGGSLWALALATGMAVLREGAETVLFVAGLMAGTTDTPAAMLLGSAIGLVAGVLVGVALYHGLARIRARALFSVTNVLILLLAGNIASQLARTLIQAGLVDQWSDPAWDISALLPDDSSLGTVLHALVGYEASPTGLQVCFYALAIVLIWTATRRVASTARPPAPAGAA